MTNDLREKFEAILMDTAGTPISTHELAGTLADVALAVVYADADDESTEIVPCPAKGCGDGICGLCGTEGEVTPADAKVYLRYKGGSTAAPVSVAEAARVLLVAQASWRYDPTDGVLAWLNDLDADALRALAENEDTPDD